MPICNVTAQNGDFLFDLDVATPPSIGQTLCLDRNSFHYNLRVTDVFVSISNVHSRNDTTYILDPSTQVMVEFCDNDGYVPEEWS